MSSQVTTALMAQSCPLSIAAHPDHTTLPSLGCPWMTAWRALEGSIVKDMGIPSPQGTAQVDGTALGVPTALIPPPMEESASLGSSVLKVRKVGRVYKFATYCMCISQ